MELEILDVIVAFNWFQSAAFDIIFQMFRGATKTRATSIFGSDAAAYELPKTSVIPRNFIFKVPVCVVVRVARNAAHYGAVVRHYQTKKKAGVRIESAKKKEVVQRVCGSDVDEMARLEAEDE